jgi:riboflavin transporter
MKTRNLIYCALFAALGAIFSAYLSIEIPMGGSKIVEISLTPVFVMLAGILFGPLLGALTGFVADTAGFFMGVQHGAYNPAFAITMAIFGLIAGLMFLKQQRYSWIRVLLLCIIAQLICSVGLNTLAIYYFYGVPLKVLFVPRLLAALVEIPVYYIAIMAILKGLAPLIKKNSL